MTAFKNGRAALAVTAGLVGALSLGSAAVAAAPVSAYAEAQVESGYATSTGEAYIGANDYTELDFADGAVTDVDIDAISQNGGNVKVDKLIVDGKETTGPFTTAVYTFTNLDGEDNPAYSYKDQLGTEVKWAGKGAVTPVKGTYVLAIKPASGATRYVTFRLTDKGAADVTFKFDGKEVHNSVANPTKVVYNSLDALDRLSVVAEDNTAASTGRLQEGEDKDYTVIVKKKEDGNWVTVDKVVDKGDYKVSIKSDEYEGDEDFYLTIDPLSISKDADDYEWDYTYTSEKDAEAAIDKIEDLEAVTGNAYTTAVGYVRAKAQLVPGKSDLAYTGSEIKPTYQAVAKAAFKVKKVSNVDYRIVLDQDKTTWVDLPADQVSAYYADSKSGATAALQAAGDYDAEVTLAKGGNFALSVANLELTVSGDRVFTDVASTAWYADAVYDANTKGYMTGLAGTQTFDPEGSLTRGQAVQVLYNMASEYSNFDDFNHNSQSGYKSYEDVASGAWYAKAVAWAKAYGVVNGYPDGTFKAEQLVSRQEFAQMLRNYAAKTQQGTDAKADLSSYADANELGWGRDAVAWAVANKAMGQNTTVLKPTSNISRAEVAAMVTRFQPNGKLK